MSINASPPAGFSLPSLVSVFSQMVFSRAVMVSYLCLSFWTSFLSATRDLGCIIEFLIMIIGSRFFSACSLDEYRSCFLKGSSRSTMVMTCDVVKYSSIEISELPCLEPLWISSISVL